MPEKTKSKAERAREATDKLAEKAGGVPKRVKDRRASQDSRLSDIMGQIARQRNAQSTDSNN